MNLIPVSLSLLVSFMSAITIVGTLAKMYKYSFVYWWIGVSYIFVVARAAHIFITVFYRSRVTSTYEYSAHPPLSDRQMMNLSQFVSEVDPVSHLAEERMGYRHHSFVLNVQPTGVDIIHYGSTIYCSGKVEKTFLKFDKMDFTKGVYRISSNGYPESMKEKEEAISRAHSRLGEEKYMLAINNCEHFVIWALTGTPYCHQIKGRNRLKWAFGDVVDAVSNKKSKISTLVYGVSSISPAEVIGKAVVEKAEAKCIQTLEKNVVEATGAATAAGNVVAEEALETVGKSALLKPSSSISVITVALGTAFEIGTLATDLNDLNESRDAGIISERDYNRGIITRISGALGSFAGRSAGTIIGQAVIPLPIWGRFVGCVFGSVITSAAASALSGLAFDIVYD